MEAIAAPALNAELEALRAKRRQYRATFILNHPEAYKNAKKRSNAKMIQRRREDPVIRAKHVEEHRLYNATHKEQRAAYNKAYDARKKAEREAGRKALAGQGALGT